MSDDDQEHLADLKEARKTYRAILLRGDIVNRYRIGNREVQRSEIVDIIAKLTQQIKDAEADVNIATHGRAKTLVRFRRKP